MSKMKDQWINDPFPYLIVDNFLEKEDFNSLTKELDQTKQQLQNNFKTPLESKLIFKDTLSKKVSKRLVDIMASTNIKDIISQQVGTSEIISMAENKSFSGYSPYHITENNGFLGTHVDHSFVDDGNLRHIANTIYYASSKWVDGWGGQTIFFSRNGYLQDVDLVAWGQDANFYYSNTYVVFVNDDPEIENDTLFYFSISEPTVWNNDKPHVIYGLVVIENGASLEIMEGTEVYLHHSSNLVVGELWYRSNDVPIKSSLKVLGNNSNRVLFTSDRLDEYYKDIPGQWGRIWLTANSSENVIQNATIKNGTIGLHIDTVANVNEPSLRLENTIISNHSSYGILAYSSKIEASNCQINDNGAHDVFLFAGGDYRFSHCTFANYSVMHQAPSIRMSNYYEDFMCPHCDININSINNNEKSNHQKQFGSR